MISSLLSADLWPLDIFSFSLLLWLGSYLCKRHFQQIRVRLTGFTLLSASCAVCCFILSQPISPISRTLIQMGQSLMMIVALFWTGTLIFSLPEDSKLASLLAPLWYRGVLPLAVITCVVSFIFDSVFPLLLMLAPLLLVIGLVWPAMCTKGSNQILFSASLILVVILGIALYWFPHTFFHLLIGMILFLSGMLVAIQDAIDQGEALWPDLLRSLDYALLTALIFGGQVIFLILLVTGITFPSLIFLQSTLATAIIIQVFSYTFVKLLDRIAFARFPQLRQERAELHTTIDVLPRMEQETNLESMDEAEFTRLTRRALSHLGDLSRLASNPLTRLPGIKTRLKEKGIKEDDVLEHANELKTFLTESIERLKPRSKGAFGTSDEWRYYNSLYFPYVMGTRPYSRRLQQPANDPVAREALLWFQSQVPERTLHNWQKTAATLVAQDLRSKEFSSLPQQKKRKNDSA